MMAIESVPRFIQTQGGASVQLAQIGVLRVWAIGGNHGVGADLGPGWDVTLGVYGSEEDAKQALGRIMGQIATSNQAFVFAPSRDFRTTEAGE